MVEKSWRTGERIAAILEKALTPEARVERNVSLPVFGQPNRKPRQCDAVIRYGNPPRELVAIVEVQERKRKPDINTFHGWIRKMQEVGAQQLICVSAMGYPRSVMDEVSSRIGPTVKLMTVSEVERVKEPGQIFMLPFLVS